MELYGFVTVCLETMPAVHRTKHYCRGFKKSGVHESLRNSVGVENLWCLLTTVKLSLQVTATTLALGVISLIMFLHLASLLGHTTAHIVHLSLYPHLNQVCPLDQELVSPRY